MAQAQSRDEVKAVIDTWEAALAAHDADALVACYAPEAVLESPVAAHLRGSPGVCRGHDELRALFLELVGRTPEVRQYHRASFFTEGHRAIWEYPRETPSGEQMDFVEVMEIEDGLIRAHCVYWGWRGVDVLTNDQYHR